jgi:Lar family restriction alleviation protein
MWSSSRASAGQGAKGKANMNERKACPFCGKEDLIVAVPSENESHYVECNGCLTLGPSGDTFDEALSAWNTRAGVAVELPAPSSDHTAIMRAGMVVAFREAKFQADEGRQFGLGQWLRRRIDALTALGITVPSVDPASVEALAKVLAPIVWDLSCSPDAYEGWDRCGASLQREAHKLAAAAIAHCGHEVARLREEVATWKMCASDADGRGRAAYQKVADERDQQRERAEKAEANAMRMDDAQTDIVKCLVFELGAEAVTKDETPEKVAIRILRAQAATITELTKERDALYWNRESVDA